MELSRFPRRSLAFLPTPLTELPRLAAAIGLRRLFMKRDDQTGLAIGGNKARKLEFLVGDALARGCDTLVTGGAAQSNHCRQTAAAAAACGLGCHLVLGLPADGVPGNPHAGPPGGNLLLDGLLGAEIHWSERRKGEDMPRIAEELRASGRRPCIIPYGGSNAIGALGFADAVREIGSQLAASGIAPSRIVFASSSGGTHAGLMAGARLFGPAQGGTPPEICGICIDKAADEGIDFADRVLALANDTAELLGLGSRFGRPDLVLRREFTGGGYGVVGELERRAIALAARTEGILLDPVYTGRAFGALMSMAASGEIAGDETVVFWHTGGTPALFSYAGALG